MTRPPAVAPAQRSEHDRPPMVLQAGTWTTHYARLGRGVGFNGRGRIFIGDTLLGRVPRLAIAASASGEWWLLHCNLAWHPRSAWTYPSLAEAQAAAEDRYPGSASRWLRTGYTRQRAEASVERASRGRTCSFCGRRPDQVNEQMFLARQNTARICDACVDALSTRRRTYREQFDDQQERLLNTVTADRPVRIVLRSRVLVLLDLGTFERHRASLQAMEGLDEAGRRRALSALGRRGIAVRELEAFKPGLYRFRPADLEPAPGRTRDILAVDSGAVVLADLDALPAVAEALTPARYDALSGNTDRGATAWALSNRPGGPRFAVLQGRPRRAYSGHGRFRLRTGSPVLVSDHTPRDSQDSP